MGFTEYVESWKFLNQPGGDDVIKRAFDAVDVDGSGLLEWDEYVFSIMGEAALKYGLLADMETLSTGLDSTLKEVTLLKEALEESAAASGVRADRNKNLRARLENMRGDVANQMNDMIAQMMNINPEDVLSDEEINAHLKSAFNKFDKDSSGELGEWEFTQAWVFLGLKGTEDEIKESFKTVDTNNSGLIDLKEFQTAIKNDRLLELNLGQFLNKIGVNYQSNADQYAAFAAAQKRRRIMKKEYEDNVAKVTKEIIAKLSDLSDAEVPKKDPKHEQQYQTLRDTFDAFDKDGSLELGYEEYRESWKFLNRPGSDSEIK